MQAEQTQLDKAVARVALECSRTEDFLQTLTVRRMKAEDEQRGNIAGELHNDMNQELAMLAVDLRLLLRLLPAGDPVLIESILKLQQRAEVLSANLA